MRVWPLAAFGTVLAPAALFALDMSSLRSELEAQFSETLERPLFVQSRRPAIVEVVATPEPAPTPVVVPVVHTDPPLTLRLSTYELTGVLISGDRRLAILRHSASGEVFRVQPGEYEMPGENGAKLTVQIDEVLPESLTLTSGRTITLSLRDSETEGIRPYVAPKVETMTAENTPSITQTTELSQNFAAPISPGAPSSLRQITVAAAK